MSRRFFAFLLLLLCAGSATAQVGTSIPAGQTITVDAHGECREVTNPGSGTRMVFTSTAPEWQSFRDNPNGLEMAECSGGGLTCASPTYRQCSGTTYLGLIDLTSGPPQNWAGCEAGCRDNYPSTTCAQYTHVVDEMGVAIVKYCNCMGGGSVPTGTALPFDAICNPPYKLHGAPPGQYCEERAAACGSTPPQADCSGPWGTVAHGAFIIAFAASSVPHGSSCVSQIRACTNGTLSGSYTHQACTIDANCNGPWGTVAHGASITAYQAASVPHGSNCASQTRTCTNGTLSGSYTHQACTVDSPPAGGTWVMRGGYAYPPLSPPGCRSTVGDGICSCSGMPEPGIWPDAYSSGQSCSQVGTCAGPLFDEYAMDIWLECK